MHFKILVGLLFFVFSTGMSKVNSEQIQITGTFSDMCRNKETGDLLGMEIMIIYARDSYYALFQASEGEPDTPTLSKAVVNGTKIVFEIPEFVSPHGKFTGVILKDGLKGNIVGLKTEKGYIFLKRQQSYWNRGAEAAGC